MILALDLGTKTGWAVASSGVIVRSGVESFKQDKFAGGGQRYLAFRRWLEKQTKPDKLVFEAVRRHIGTDAAHVYGGLLAILTSWCEENRTPYEGVPVQTIKKFISGRGNAKKDEVAAAVRARGFNPKDDNEADALALALFELNQT